LQVGLAIFGKGAPISDCFEGGTQSVSMSARRSADATQQRFAKVGIFNGGGSMVMQAAAKRLRGAPRPIMWGALAHELAARIRQLAQRAD